MKRGNIPGTTMAFCLDCRAKLGGDRCGRRCPDCYLIHTKLLKQRNEDRRQHKTA